MTIQNTTKRTLKSARALKSLRERLGDSQQAMATRLGLSIRAIANYEKDREPTGRVLVQLMKLSTVTGNSDLSQIFQSAISQQLGHQVPQFGTTPAAQELLPGETEEISILLAVLRTPGYKKVKAKWLDLTASIRQSHVNSDANVLALFGLHSEIRQLIADGKNDKEIILALPKWDAALVETLARNLRTMDRLAQEDISK